MMVLAPDTLSNKWTNHFSTISQGFRLYVRNLTCERRSPDHTWAIVSLKAHPTYSCLSLCMSVQDIPKKTVKLPSLPTSAFHSHILEKLWEWLVECSIESHRLLGGCIRKSWHTRCLHVSMRCFEAYPKVMKGFRFNVPFMAEKWYAIKACY